MDSGSGTKNENHLKAGVSDKLTDAQLLEKFGIKTCFVRIDCLKSDECGAAVIKSSSQKITGSNRPFDLNREFQGSHFSEKQTEQEVRINPACNTKRLPYYGTNPDILMVKEIPLITVNSDSEEEEPNWKRELIIEQKDIHEHLNHSHVPDSDSEIKKERDIAKHKSTSQLHLNNKSNESDRVFKKKRSNGGNLKEQSKHPKRNKQNTAVQAINDALSEIQKERDMDLMTHRNMIKQQSTKSKTSQCHLNNKSNQTDSKVLKRTQSDDIMEKQGKRHRRNVQNIAVEAVNDGDPEIKKEVDIDHILRKKYGIKKCYVVIPLPPPEILELLQPQSFKVHYGQQFLREIALQAYSLTGSKVVNLDSAYKEAKLSKFSSLSRREFDHQIMVFVKGMYARDSFIKKRLEIISRLQAELDKLVTKKRFWYNNKTEFIIVEDRNAAHLLIHRLLKNIKYPSVLAKRNEAVFLAKKLSQQNKINYKRSQEPDCSNYKECDNDNESNCTQMSNFPVKMDEKLHDLDNNDKKSHIEKQPLDIETETTQNNDSDASSYFSKPCEGLQYQLLVKHPLTAVTEMAYFPFQLTDNNEHTDTTNALKEVAYDMNPECNSLTLGTEIPLSMEHIDDASENKIFGAANECNSPSLNREIPRGMECCDYSSEKSFNAANEEFFVIDEDDDDSEKKSCVSYSEE